MKEIREGTFIPKGSLVDNYSIETKLAKGGYGTVHSARELTTGEQVAVKFGTPANREMFTTEAAIHKAVDGLKNPHILPYKGDGAIIRSRKGKDFELPYIVTERAQMSLHEEVAMNGPLPLAQASDVVTQVADALTAIHEEGYVHADVKPANILITEGETVLLGDFGLASRFPRTQEEGITITPSYAAPEQWEGLTIPESDAYNLGLVLFAGATGKVLLDRSQEDELKMVTNEAYHDKFVNKRIDEINLVLQDPLKRVLTWDFSKRPTAWEFSWDVAMRVLELRDDSKRKPSFKTIFDLRTTPQNARVQEVEKTQTVFAPNYGQIDNTN